jgi:hypothetical protein
MVIPASCRRAGPRTEVALPVSLARPRGNPIAARTVDLGAGGMRVEADRPLAIDELVSFDLHLDAEHHVAGTARVLREQAPHRYALRFEALAAADASRVAALVAAT